MLLIVKFLTVKYIMMKKYLRSDFLKFLKALGYHMPPSYQGDMVWYYNPKTRGRLGIPYSAEAFSEEEIKSFFKPEGAGVLASPELDWYNFLLFINRNGC